MKDIKLVPSLPDKTKFELALERLEEEKEYDESLQFKIRIFYNKHLMDFIELNEDHDFLSDYEKFILKLLADYLLEGIMEDVSSANLHRFDFW